MGKAPARPEGSLLTLSFCVRRLPLLPRAKPVEEEDENSLLSGPLDGGAPVAIMMRECRYQTSCISSFAS